MSQTNKDDPERRAKHSGSMKTDSLGESVEPYPTTLPARQQYGTLRTSRILLPEPPLGVSRARWSIEKMTLLEATRWIKLYNEWVDRWNFAEANSGVPLSPGWSDAAFVYGPKLHLPRSTLGFEPHGEDRMGVIRFRNWLPFHEGWSFARQVVRVDKIIWAGWLQPNQGQGGRNNG